MLITEVKNKIPKEVVTLLREIQDNMWEFDVYLGGGLLRDIFTGKAPKDIDVFLVPREGCIWDGRDYIPEDTMVTYRKGTDDIELSGDMKKRGVQSLVGLWHKTLKTQDVQYIIYDKELSQQELSEDFDMNICQITYGVEADHLYYTNAFLEGHVEEKIECLKSYCEDRKLARYKRMEKKYPNYTVVGKPDTIAPSLLGDVVGVKRRRSGTSQSNSV